MYPKENNYGRQRLKFLGLTKSDGFSADKDGSILIHYHHLDGTPAMYEHENNRKTNAIECPDEYLNKHSYVVKRLTPSLAIEKRKKYDSPFGSTALPFIPAQVRDAYQKGLAFNFVVFTEGELKAAVMAKRFGVPTASFKGISNFKLSEDTKELIQYSIAKNSQFFVVLNYDSDAIQNSDISRLAAFYVSAHKFVNELRTFCHFQGIATPQVKICIQNPNQPHKGIDDLLLAVGIPALQDFCTFKTSENFIFSDIDTAQPYNQLSNFFGYRSNKYKTLDGSLVIRSKWMDKDGNRLYLTDALKASNIALDSVFGSILSVPTGYGKTSLIIQLAKQGNRVVFFVPTIALVKQIVSDAMAQGVDAMEYDGTPANRQNLIDRFRSESDKYPQLIVCTYSSAASLGRALGSTTNLYNLVFDEYHNSTAATSYGFQLSDINNILDIAPNFLSFTGLTATPLFDCHPFTKDLLRLTVVVSGIPNTAATVIQAKNALKTTAKAIKRSIADGRLPVVLFNNKSARLETLLTLLPNVEGLKVFNSENKDDSEWLKLLQTAKLSSDVKAVITTSVLKEGINIYNDIDTDIIVIGNHHPTTIRQFCSRFRKAATKLYIIQTDKETSARYIDTDKELAAKVKQAQSTCDNYNTETPEYYTQEIRKALQTLFTRESNGIFIPDYLAIQNFVLDTETAYLNADPERLLKVLKNYDFEPTIQGVVSDFIEFTECEKQAVKERSDQRKLEKVQAFCNVVKTLTDAPYKHTEATQQIDSQSTPKQDKEFYSMFLELAELLCNEDKALELLIHTNGSKGKVKLTIARIQAQKANFDSHYLGNAAAAIKRSFDIGRSYTPQQLKDLFLDCIRTDKTIDLTPFEKAKRIDGILKRLRIFFEVKRCGQGGKDFILYKIDNLT